MRRPGFIAEHSARPSGFVGRVVASIMQRETESLNRQVVTTLRPRPGEVVLDVGAGSGISLRLLAERARRATGVDHSAVMCARAAANCRSLIERGRVRVVQARSDDLPFDEASFDAVISVHTIYFWEPLEPHLAEIARVIRPGGRAVFAFRCGNHPAATDFPDSTYTFRSQGEVETALSNSGLRGAEARQSGDGTLLLSATRQRR